MPLSRKFSLMAGYRHVIVAHFRASREQDGFNKKTADNNAAGLFTTIFNGARRFSKMGARRGKKKLYLNNDR